MSFPSNGNWVAPAGYAEAFAKDLGRLHCEAGKVRLKGSTITKDEEEGVAWLRSAAISGDAGAQYELGRCHDEGRGVEQDVAGAIKWYEAAAQRAHPQAICTLGYCYAKGHGVAQDEASAARLFLRAAQLKAPEGQDFARAVELYRKAAAQGHEAAMCNLAHCLEKGQGVKRDEEAAFWWFNECYGKKQSEQARYHVGRCYFLGIGTARDERKAGALLGERVWELGRES